MRGASKMHRPRPGKYLPTAVARGRVARGAWVWMDALPGDPAENFNFMDVLQAENKVLMPGETYPLTIYADPSLQAEGMQFTLQYDPKKLQFESLLTDSILLSMMGVFEEEGLLTLSWASKMIPESMVLSLPFKALQRGEIADMIQIGDRITRSEAYIGERTLPVNIAFTEKTVNSPIVLNPYPNQFMEKVNIMR